MHRAFSVARPFSRRSNLPRATPNVFPTHRNSTMATRNRATGNDSRPVFFFDIDNCVGPVGGGTRELAGIDWLTFRDIPSSIPRVRPSNGFKLNAS